MNSADEFLSEIHNTTEELNRFSDQYINETFQWMKDNPPIQCGALAKVFDPDGKLYAIGRVMGVEWVNCMYVVDVEIAEECGVVIRRFCGANVVQHKGFLARSVG